MWSVNVKIVVQLSEDLSGELKFGLGIMHHYEMRFYGSHDKMTIMSVLPFLGFMIKSIWGGRPGNMLLIDMKGSRKERFRQLVISNKAV